MPENPELDPNGWPIKPETFRNDADSAWGLLMCKKLSEIMGSDEMADFYDASNMPVYRVTQFKTGVFALKDLRSGAMYGVNHLGDPRVSNVEGQERSKDDLQKVVDEIINDEFPELAKRKVQVDTV